MGVHIVRGVLARDHVHMFLSIPPKLSLSDVMQRIMGRSSRRVASRWSSPSCANAAGAGGFPSRACKHALPVSGARGYFSTTSGNVVDLRYDTTIEAVLEQLIATGATDLGRVFGQIFELALQIEREQFLNASQYERTPERQGYTNGQPVLAK